MVLRSVDELSYWDQVLCESTADALCFYLLARENAVSTLLTKVLSDMYHKPRINGPWDYSKLFKTIILIGFVAYSTSFQVIRSCKCTVATLQ